MHPDAATFERILGRALGAGDYADAFYERRVSRSFRFQDGRVHEAGISVSSGVGIRVLTGERAGYAYSDALSKRPNCAPNPRRTSTSSRAPTSPHAPSIRAFVR